MNKVIVFYTSTVFLLTIGVVAVMGQSSRFEAGAKKGFARDQYYLAEAYKNGDKVEQRLNKAKYWYKKSIKQGFHKAKVSLGVLYYEQHKYYKALYWFKKAAYQGNPNGQYYLGLMYYHGLGIAPNKEEAQYWFDKSIDYGQPTWRTWLAKGDTLKTFQWHLQHAKDGEPESQYYLASMYEQGQGTTQNLEQAFEWYKTSLKSYNSPAYRLLGSWEGIPKSVWKVFRQQATNGDAKMQYKLAELYRSSYRYKRALYWFEKSALQANPKAQTSLGTMFFYGRGVDKNYKKALQWYKKAEANNHFAQFNLGMMYYEGKGVAVDKKQALYYFEKSAKQGFLNAQMLLAYTYAIDLKDHKKAFIWCSKAAEQGASPAQYQLAMYYREGIVVAPNLRLEKYWMQKAADNGYQKAKKEMSKYED